MSHENDFFNDLDGPAPQRTAPPPPLEEGEEEEGDRTPPQVIDPSLPMSAASSEGRPAAEEVEDPKEDDKVEMKESEPNFNDSIPAESEKSSSEDPEEERTTGGGGGGLEYYYNYTGGENQVNEERREPLVWERRQTSDSHLSLSGEDHVSDDDMGVFRRHSGGGTTSFHPHPITTTVTPPSDPPAESPPQDFEDVEAGENIASAPSTTRSSTNNITNSTSPPPFSTNMPTVPSFGDQPHNSYNVRLSHHDSERGLHEDSGSDHKYNDGDGAVGQASRTSSSHHEGLPPFTQTPNNIDGFTFDSGVPAEFEDYRDEPQAPPTHVQHTQEAEIEAGVTHEAPEQFNDRMQEQEEPPTHVQHTQEAEMETGVTHEAPEQFNDRMQEQRLTPNFSYQPTNFTHFQNNDNISLLDTPEFSAVPPDRIQNPVTLPQEYQSYSAASNADDLRERERGLEMTSSAAQIGSSQDFLDYNRSNTDVVQNEAEYNPPERELAGSNNGNGDGEVIVAGGTEREERSANRNENPNDNDEEMKKSFTAFISKMRSQRESSVNRAHFHSFEEYPESVTEELAKVDNYFVSISDPRDGQFRHRKGSPFTVPYLLVTRNVYVQALLLLLFLICWIMIVVQIFGGGGSTCFFTFICMLLFTLDYLLLFLFQKMDRFAVGNQYWRLSEPFIILLMLIFEIVELSIWAGAKARNGAFIAFVILRFIGWSAHGYTRLEQFQYGLRCLCSADRRRYQAEGFDMDFAYIHRNIVAMAWPANNFEKLFRNSLSEVVTYLDRKHPQSYLVINLCSERTYNPTPFHHQTSWYPMDDHNPGELSMVLAFCKEPAPSSPRISSLAALLFTVKEGKGEQGHSSVLY